MASTYPGTLDTFTDMGSTLNGPPTHSAVHALVHDALDAIEGELGTNPSGSSATVAARFTALDSTVSTNASTASSAVSAAAVTAAAATAAVAQGWLTGASSTATTAFGGAVTADLTGASVNYTEVSGRRYRVVIDLNLQATSTTNGSLLITDASNNVHRASAITITGSGERLAVRVEYSYTAGASGSVTKKGRVYAGGTLTMAEPLAASGVPKMTMDVYDEGAV